MKKYLVLTLCIALTGLLSFRVGLGWWGAWHDEWSGYNGSLAISDGYCNIAVVPIVGDIYIDEPSNDGSEYYAVANADEVVAYLRAAEYDPYIYGIVARIDSFGGTPVASQIIADALKRSTLPTAAVIREMATSGGYLAATGADTIIASPFSDVGGIGITLSYVENTAQNVKEGLRFVSLASAPYKDYGNPNKSLTVAERAILERDLKIYHDEFVKEVSENRNLPIEDVARLADGSSVPGELALESGLIDTLGDQETAKEWFAEQFGVMAEGVVFCE